MKPVSIFVDVHSLYAMVKRKYKGRKLDYLKYSEEVTKDNAVIFRAFAYGYQDDNEAQSFISYLNMIGFETRYQPKTVNSFRCNWNVGMSMDVVRLVGKSDTIIIGSSDRNLIPLVKWIREHGVRCIIFSCCVPKELREAADECIEITEEHLEQVEE